MNIATIEMPRVEARQAYLEYQHVIKAAQQKELDEMGRRQLVQDQAIAAGYRALSIGRQLIRLTDTLRAGGRREKGYPKLAIMRADIETVEMDSWPSGRTRYRPYEPRWNAPQHQAASKVLSFEMGEYNGNSVEGICAVPPVPPQFRPNGHARNYHILWEVARWGPVRRSVTRARVGDPALLKHLRGDLWAVLAVWDLTEVEKAALEAGSQ